ncbi:hypothetical protein CONCODRAFT_69190 [Conidiobolus coronatus NRRL 28638]|uniref:Uncharacterized protein n=1 Tax=Conidiobolus coronatus (strain ATCC 28846 / CBS 209.66 / NRRL 28638) TaxID=796925 RepID=A0A137PB43_CONC2|nr:hypothetical protein CONCODRAFT_69190 [Conidiobolus coronatus NRRL 28638]|eukprot:KXN72228.1 hypothetical protein CONCODRAFT_69190 [Conidiobolus coronatus NRRL 28638]
MELGCNLKIINEWIEYHLKYYKIIIFNKSEIEFFGKLVNKVKLNDIQGNCLVCTELKNATSKAAVKLLMYLEEFKRPPFHSIVDLSAEILRIANYESITKILRTNFTIDFEICGKLVKTCLDICLVEDKRIILIMKENRHFISQPDIELQLVSDAVAAFQYNNNTILLNNLGMQSDNYTFPVIVFTGSSPLFYKIEINKELSDCIKLGTYPCCYTELDVFNPDINQISGMDNIDSRIRVFKCLKLFKNLFRL